MTGIPDGRVEAEHLLGLFQPHQVDLIGHDQRRQPCFSAMTRNRSSMRRRGVGMGAGEDEHGLVGVGQDDLLVHALGPWVEPHQRAAAWFDRLDAARAVRHAGHLHPVAHRGDIAHVLCPASGGRAGDR